MENIKSGLVFPKPKKTISSNDYLVIGDAGLSKCRIYTDVEDSLLLAESTYLLAEQISGKIGVCPEIVAADINQDLDNLITISISIYSKCQGGNSTKEGYVIEINDEGVHICGSSDKGVFYAVQTLAQLFEMQGSKLALPWCKIEDWPDMQYRGLFIEDRYGPDMMTLEDWKNTVDYMASLKMNFLGVGIYGCWSIQYSNQISEFWYIPIQKYPELRTERTIRYYSPAEGVWKAIKFVPAMFKDDFLSELIAYGEKRNVIVRPHFNSMGHNTLIPRLFPETSAKDAEGNSIGYSFCISNEKTYEVLFNIYDEIIDRYLTPNGIDWFHMGLDEVWDTRGVDPNDPFKVHNPWCQCKECSQHTHEELFMEHTIKLAKYLKGKGIKNITMWHDQLLKMGLMEEMANRLKKEGLYENVILNWWKYSTTIFETTMPELGMRRFMSPMTGYYHWMATDSYLTNIYKMLQLGHAEGAEGAESYCTFDLSYDRNLYCFSEYTWNKTDIGDLDSFRERYIKKHFLSEYDTVRLAFDYFDKLVEPGEKHTLVMNTISYYMYTYVRPEKDYPRNFPGEIFMAINANVEKNKAFLKEAIEESTKAYELFDSLAKKMEFDNSLLEHYKVECMNYKVLASEALGLVELFEKHKAVLEAESENSDNKEIIKALQEFKAVISDLIRDRKSFMLSLEKTKLQYLVPSEMRNASIHMQYLIDISNYLDNLVDDAKAGRELHYPLLDLQDMRAFESELAKLVRYK